MREALRIEMNRIWKMKTAEFIPELGKAFHGVSNGEINQSTSPEALAAILHRTYSMLQGSVFLNRECFNCLDFQDHEELEASLRTLLQKTEEAHMPERDAFSWLAQRPKI